MASVAPDVLMRQIAGGAAPAIVDVRSKKEFDAGHVPGAVHIPFWLAGRRCQELASMRERPVVIYCGHGPRAYLAGAAFARCGFTQVVYLAGHMKRWRELNLPLEGE